MQSLNVHYRGIDEGSCYGDVYLIWSQENSFPFSDHYSLLEGETGSGEHDVLHIRVDGQPFIRLNASGRPLEASHRDRQPWGWYVYTSGIDSYKEEYYGWSSTCRSIFHVFFAGGKWFIREGNPDSSPVETTWDQVHRWFRSYVQHPVSYMKLDAYDWKTICADFEPPAPTGLEYSLFLDAMSGVYLDTNNIANAIDIVKTVIDVMHLNSSQLLSDFRRSAKVSKKNLSRAWLAYRYQYTTTKSDIEEISSKASSVTLPTNNWRIGRSSKTYDNVTLRCKIPYRDSTMAGFTSMWSDLKKFGLAPDLYNLWDLVPLSFVADWVLPIGDTLEAYSKVWLTSQFHFEFGTQCWSKKWSREIPFGDTTVKVSYYKRWLTTNVPSVEVYETSPHSSTVLKRILDGVAMYFG